LYAYTDGSSGTYDTVYISVIYTKTTDTAS
jgi:hypothetical protein